MIISPPFLPDRQNNESDEAFVARAMTLAENGLFPVSRQMQWHGGVHLQAPAANSPVRAIADGRIVYLRQPTAQPQDRQQLEQHAQYVPERGWIDNGCIILRHQTEIGENIALSYFSIYMHLSRIEANLVQGHNVHRKTPLGSAGQIYGRQNQIHFEIIAADNQIENLIGSLTLNRNGANYQTHRQQHINHFINQNGRTACCFGSSYFYLPTNTPAYTAVHDGEEYTYTPTGRMIGQDLYVEMKYHQGNCTFTSYNEHGVQVGLPHTNNSTTGAETIYEYNLFEWSSEICPAMPTAGFELLRFGRVLGNEALDPPQAAHFRQIPLAHGTTWVNLNHADIKVYSDADFPFWKGWRVADDDANDDSRCDSAVVRAILDNGRAGSFAGLDEQQQQAHLRDPLIRAALHKTFYKFPTEWQQDNFQARFSWLQQPQNQGGLGLTEQQLNQLQTHVNALVFWEDAALAEIDVNHWHLPPVAFIQHFRQCDWLSQSELKQLIPSHTIRGNNWEAVNATRVERTTRDQLINAIHLNLNKTLRKYAINTPLRMACFFGNAIQESSWLKALSENGGNTYWYSPWYGRGLLQLTHAYSYRDYWQFRGRAIPPLFNDLIDTYRNVQRIRVNDARGRYSAALTNAERIRQRVNFQDNRFPSLAEQFNWRNDVAAEANIDPVDSAGFYWASKGMAVYADQIHSLERVTINSNRGQQLYYRSPAFWRASATVNLPAAVNRNDYAGLNGFDQRCSAYGNCLAVLAEINFPDASGQLTLEFPSGYTRRAI